jgi:hypothetical protein
MGLSRVRPMDGGQSVFRLMLPRGAGRPCRAGCVTGGLAFGRVPARAPRDIRCRRCRVARPAGVERLESRRVAHEPLPARRRQARDGGAHVTGFRRPGSGARAAANIKRLEFWLDQDRAA